MWVDVVSGWGAGAGLSLSHVDPARINRRATRLI